MSPIGLTVPVGISTNNPKGRPMRKLVRPVQKVKSATVGLDVHQHVIVYARMDRHGDEVGKGSIRSRPEDLVRFLSDLDRPVHVAFEAGGSTFWVYDVLVAELGADFVHVAQSKRIRAIANSTQKQQHAEERQQRRVVAGLPHLRRPAARVLHTHGGPTRVADRGA